MKYIVLTCLILSIAVFATPHHGSKGPSSTKTSKDSHSHSKSSKHIKKNHKNHKKTAPKHPQHKKTKNHDKKKHSVTKTKTPNLVKSDYHFKSFSPHKKQTHCLHSCFRILSKKHKDIPEYKKNFVCHKKCGVALVSIKHVCKNYPNLCKVHHSPSKHHFKSKGANGAKKSCRIRIPFEIKGYYLKKHNEIHDSLKQVGEIKPNK